MEYFGMSILKRGACDKIVMKRRCRKCKHIIEDLEPKYCSNCGVALKIKPKYQSIQGVVQFLDQVEE